jgi:hypothetical protein
MGQTINFDRFKHLTYETFRAMARDSSLSPHEKIGFPDSYRAGKAEAIFADIRAKLPPLATRGATVMDIGCGCDDLALMMIDHAARHDQRLILIDAPEMLALLPDAPHITKIGAYYPVECPAVFSDYAGTVDAVLCYSVMQIMFAEGLLYPFLDQTMTLLANGGAWLIGDIPNIAKRKRFFASLTGIAFHQRFMGTDAPPDVAFNVPEPAQIDDALLFGLLMRCRAAGLDAYIVPQPADLPLANRREDIVIYKP